MTTVRKWKIDASSGQCGVIYGHNHLQRLHGIVATACRLTIHADRLEPIVSYAAIRHSDTALVADRSCSGITLPPFPVIYSRSRLPASGFQDEERRVDVSKQTRTCLAANKF